MLDIHELILSAKIGHERKDAQVDTCAPFAAALFDFLDSLGVDCRIATACYRGPTTESSWYHAVVEHDGRYYDSMGEFSEDIMRKRLKISPKTEYRITFDADTREELFDEEEFGLLHEFLVKAFAKAQSKAVVAARAATISI